jgi:DNA repair ATPase RecN
MEAQYAYWIITGAVGLMVAALAWFIKRLVAELESKIERSEKTTCERMDALEKRMDKQEERYDRLLTQLPEKYALRDDLIRMTQNIESQLSQIRELIVNGFRDKEGTGC